MILFDYGYRDLNPNSEVFGRQKLLLVMRILHLNPPPNPPTPKKKSDSESMTNFTKLIFHIKKKSHEDEH